MFGATSTVQLSYLQTASLLTHASLGVLRRLLRRPTTATSDMHDPRLGTARSTQHTSTDRLTSQSYRAQHTCAHNDASHRRAVALLIVLLTTAVVPGW